MDTTGLLKISPPAEPTASTEDREGRRNQRVSYRCAPATALDQDHLRLWAGMVAEPREGEPWSPFLHPDYTLAAASVRRDVEVCVLEVASEPVGFVPFQRSWTGVGRPVGTRLCDVAGAVVRSDVRWDPLDLTRACGLHALHLAGVPEGQRHFQRYRRRVETSPYMDLTAGYEGYRETHRVAGSKFLTQLMRKRRKLERERGAIQFQRHTVDDRVFDALLLWKERQRVATRTPDVLQRAWGRRLLDRIRRIRSDDFSGSLSALYVGGSLAAVHLGMVTPHVLHYWIPAYNVELSSYSPGLLLLLELARSAAAQGVTRVDLGRGSERYKLRAESASVTVGEVAVDLSAGMRAFTEVRYGAPQWSPTAERVLKGVHRTAARLSYSMGRLLDSRRSL